MSKFNIQEIENKIGYTFNKKNLLRQAFIRRTYSEERKKYGENIANNETLEFLGESVIYFTLIQWMMKTYGKINSSDVFDTDYDEEVFTNTRSNILNRNVLASRIDMFDLAKYLIMGKSDIINKTYQQKSVKYDLFEALVGAIALDSNYDYPLLEKLIIEKLLDPVYYVGPELQNISTNTLSELLETCQKYQLPNPEFIYREDKKAVPPKIKCKVIVDQFTARGSGIDQTAAKLHAAAAILKLLNEVLGFGEIFKDVNLDNAINRLQELYHKNFIKEPLYKYKEVPEGWKTTCKVPGIGYLTIAISESKKEAKKNAAFKMVEIVRAHLEEIRENPDLKVEGADNKENTEDKENLENKVVGTDNSQESSTDSSTNPNSDPLLNNDQNQTKSE